MNRKHVTRRTRELVCAAAVAGLTLAGLSACSSSGGSAGSRTLTVYNIDTANVKGWKQLVAPWEKQNHAQIKFVFDTSDQYVPQLQNAVRAHTALDLIIANGQDVRTFAKNGWLRPLDGVVDTAKLQPVAVQPFQIDGKLYAAGIDGANTTGAVYNQNLMAKYHLVPPTTFAAVKADVAKLNGTGVALLAPAGATLYQWPMWLMQTIQQESGGKPAEVTTATLKGQMKFTDAMYVKAFQDLAELGSSGALISGFNGLTEPTALTQVIQQKAVGFFGGTWDLGTIVQKAKFPVIMTGFPTFGSTASTPFGGPNAAVTEYAKMDASHQKLADSFVKYLTTPQFNQDYLTSTNYSAFPIPTAVGVNVPLKTAAAKTAVNDFIPKTSVFLDWSWPKNVTAVVQQQIQAVVGGHTQPQAAADAVQSAFEQAQSDGFSY